MPNNYVLLDRIELNASAASVSFDNIPQTGYTDLKLVWSTRTPNGTPTVDNISFYMNGSSANGANRVLYTLGSSAASYSDTGTYTSAGTVGGAATANTYSNGELYIPNYTGSNFKPMSVDTVTENNATTSGIAMTAMLWSQTTAVSSIGIIPNYANFSAGSTFSLYGIAAVGTTPAIAPKADGGNVIGTDGTYWYHAFLSNGTFTPQVGLNADVLVVAGGGGAANNIGGGGGAGGLVNSTLSLSSAVSYPVTIGAGGNGGGGNNIQVNGTNGVNSTFSTITAAGGGYGSVGDTNGGAGGSGGGARGTTGIGGTGNTPSTSPAQGTNGANSTLGPSAGGGGGAAQAGTQSTASIGGKGGNGSSAYSSWCIATATGENVSGTYYLAGGGGGAGYVISSYPAGAGGYGGGGAGVTATNGTGTAGTVNTGGGGGGGAAVSGTNFGGAGGSGIVIIRYPVA